MKTLGACIICKNEEKDIRPCLESIKDLDEIVIVDTGSIDSTVSICREYTKNVFTDYKWNDDFSEARNVALHRCTADYILIIDADEQLMTPVKHIKHALNGGWFYKYSGMMFNIKMIYEQFDSPRLFKNTREIYYINAAHNVPTLRGNPNALMERLYQSNFVIESGYSQAHNLDPDRTKRILEKTLRKDPDNTRAIYYLGREYINRKEIKDAVKQFEKYRDMKFNNVGMWDNELADVLYLLALCYIDNEVWGESRWFDAVQSAMWSHAVLPNSKDTCHFLCTMFAEMPGSVDQAVRAQKDTVTFWDKAQKNANDAGVLMRRNI